MTNGHFSKILLLLLIASNVAFGQGFFSRNTIEATGTLLPPRYTTTQRDALSSPVEGTIIYNLTTDRVEVYDGSDWLVSSGPEVSFVLIDAFPDTLGTANQVLRMNSAEDALEWADENDHAHAAEDITSGTLGAARLPAMVGDSGSGGTQGAVPAPASGDAQKFLRGDGTWDTLSTFELEEMPASIGTDDQILIVSSGAFVFVDANDHEHSANDITSDTLDAARLPTMVGATSGDAGTKGAVPAPSAGEEALFLRGDGTWASTTTGAISLLDLTDVPDSYGGANTLLAVNSSNDEVEFINATSLQLVGSQIVGGVVNAARLGTMTGASSGSAGVGGAVPAPTAGQQTLFLRGDGTWASATAAAMVGATGVSSGSGGTVPAPSAGEQGKYIRGDGTWDAITLSTDTDGDYVGDVASGSGISVSGTPGENYTETIALGALSADWSQTGAYDLILNNAGSELKILESAGGTYYGTIDTGDLSDNRTYTFTDESGNVVVVTSNGTSGQILQSDGDGTYSWTTASATVTAIDAVGDVNATGYSSGRILVDDGTDSWDAVSVSGDISLAANGAVTVDDTLQLGVADTTQGTLTLGSDNDTVGGALYLYNGANYDTSVDYWQVGSSPSSGSFRIKGEGGNHTWLSDAFAIQQDTGNIYIGNQIQMEGDTSDANEGVIKVANGLTGDRTYTFPDVTGTVVTTGDTGSITATMMGTDSVAADEIAEGAVGSSEIANGGVEWVDSYGGYTLAGDPALNGSRAYWASTGVLFEGATANTYEGLLTVADVTADRTWTLPDVDGTIFLTGAGQTANTGGVIISSTAPLLSWIDSDAPAGNTRGSFQYVGGASDTASYFTMTRRSDAGSFEADLFIVRTDGDLSIWGDLVTFEGATDDANETSFAITDPTADRTVTFPDSTGTVLLSGHTFTGDVTATLDTDGSTALTVASGSIGATELEATTVSAGSYYGAITVDADGRITSAATKTKPVVLTAAGGTPAITAGCAAATQLEATTNKNNYWALDFDAGTDEGAWWSFTLPDDYAGGTLSVTLYWTSAGGSAGGTVYWTVAGYSMGNDDALDVALGTAATANDDWIANGDVHVVSTGALTLGGTPAAGEVCMIRITRDADNGSDDLAGDARLLFAKLEYTPATS
jgi:hypothetical protein